MSRREDRPTSSIPPNIQRQRLVSAPATAFRHPLAAHGGLSAEEPAHTPEQHWALVVQADPVLKHDAASTAVGATILVTSGKATTAPHPSRRITSRRDTLVTPRGAWICSASRRAFPSCCKASHTTSSGTGVCISRSRIRGHFAHRGLPVAVFPDQRGRVVQAMCLVPLQVVDEHFIR